MITYRELPLYTEIQTAMLSLWLEMANTIPSHHIFNIRVELVQVPKISMLQIHT